MIYYIYKHTNKINGKVYIGQTCQKPESRWRQGEGYKNSPKFYAAIQKYGWDSFDHEIITTTDSIEKANQLEISLIAQFKANSSDFGYNLQEGGMNGLHSKETKQKMRLNQLGANNSFYGHKHSEATKALISQSERGYKHHHAKKVKCLETGKVFDTLTEAALWCNGSSNFRGKISEVCQGKRLSAGKHPITQQKLHWEYVI